MNETSNSHEFEKLRLSEILKRILDLKTGSQLNRNEYLVSELISLEEMIASQGWQVAEQMWLTQTKEFMNKLGLEGLTITPRQQQEIARLIDYLNEPRKGLMKLTFWGPPGSGKTQLARFLAEKIKTAEQKVHLVSWSSLSSSKEELLIRAEGSWTAPLPLFTLSAQFDYNF